MSTRVTLCITPIPHTSPPHTLHVTNTIPVANLPTPHPSTTTTTTTPIGTTTRYHAELAQLQPLRASAAEAAALRERAREASAAAAALAASRQELRRALDEASTGLAAASERCRQLEAASGLQQALRSMVSGCSGLSTRAGVAWGRRVQRDVGPQGRACPFGTCPNARVTYPICALTNK